MKVCHAHFEYPLRHTSNLKAVERASDGAFSMFLTVCAFVIGLIVLSLLNVVRRGAW